MLGIGLGTNKTAFIKPPTKEKLVTNAGGVLYLDARKTTGTSIPINSPLTQTWIDLSGNNNNATEKNMAGTTISGVGGSSDLPYWMFDGVDDRFDLNNTTSLDITTAPFACFMTILLPSTLATSYFLCKNTDAVANTQYSLYMQSDGEIILVLQGAGHGNTPSNSIKANEKHNIGFIWDGTHTKMYIDGIVKATSTYSGTLTSQPNVCIGCRSNTGGTYSSFFKGGIATITVYTGAKATEVNILKAEKAISKAYLS